MGQRPIARIIAVVAVLVATGCGTTTGTAPNIEVIATTSIWGDVVAQILGDDGVVEVMIPTGTDAHEYRASPSQVAGLLGADLVVVNGLGLEESLEDVLTSAEDDGANVIWLGDHIDPLPFAGHDDEDPVEGDDAHGEFVPHFWFDPTRVAEAARAIAAELSSIDDSIDWVERAETYAGVLENADSEVETTLSRVPVERRKLVTNHEAFGYFADRYEFEVIGVVVPGGSTLNDPSSAELAALVDEIISEGIPAIFAETSQPTRLAEAVAAEVGDDITVVELHTESVGEPGSGAETLIGMLTTNAILIAEALS